MGNYLTQPHHAALAGFHPTYFLLGFSAALAPKFPHMFPVVASGSGDADTFTLSRGEKVMVWVAALQPTREAMRKTL